MVVGVLADASAVGVPVVGVDVQIVTELVRALVAEDDLASGAFDNAVHEHAVAAVKLENEIVIVLVAVGLFLPLRNQLALAALALEPWAVVTGRAAPATLVAEEAERRVGHIAAVGGTADALVIRLRTDHANIFRHRSCSWCVVADL